MLVLQKWQGFQNSLQSNVCCLNANSKYFNLECFALKHCANSSLLVSYIVQ